MERGEILERLARIEEALVVIEKKLDTVCKHVPFVDTLAESGVVRAVGAINSAVARLNPFNYPIENED